MAGGQAGHGIHTDTLDRGAEALGDEVLQQAHEGPCHLCCYQADAHHHEGGDHPAARSRSDALAATTSAGATPSIAWTRTRASTTLGEDR